MSKTYVSNGKYLLIFAQGLVNGRKARYILLYDQRTSKLLDKKKVSLKNGNSAFKKSLTMGYRKIKVEMA